MLTLAAPTTLTTIVEYLPQIIISALVGHADPHTALPHLSALEGDESSATATASREGTILEVYGLANLVYSTCAFSVIYGLICGLDSVAASSYGVAMREAEVVASLAEAEKAEKRADTSTDRDGRCGPEWRSTYGSVAASTSHSRTFSASSQAHSPRVRPVTVRPFRPGLHGGVPLSLIHLTSHESSQLPGSDRHANRRGSFPSVGFENEQGNKEVKRRVSSAPHTPILTSAAETRPLLSSHQHHESAPSPHESHIIHSYQRSGHDRDEPMGTEASSSSQLRIDSSNFHFPRHLKMSPLSLEGGAEGCTERAVDEAAALHRQPAQQMPANISVKHLPRASTLMGMWIERCLVLSISIAILLVILLYFGCDPVLRGIGEPAHSIAAASDFVFVSSLSLPFVAAFHALNKGLQASGIVLPILVIASISKVAACVGVWACLFVLRRKLVSVAWILTVSMATQTIAVVAYMQHAGIIQRWWGGSSSFSFNDRGVSFVSRLRDWFHGLYSYTQLALPACVAICLEFALFDTLGAISGVLPEKPSRELATHYMLFTTTLGCYMCFSGLCVAVSVVVGQKLSSTSTTFESTLVEEDEDDDGSRSTQQGKVARLAAMVGTSACVVTSGLIILILALAHGPIAHLLTSDASLRERYAECVPVLLSYQLVDSLNTNATSLLRTLGVQKYGVVLHVLTYYMVGVGASVVLAFRYDLGVRGLWMGLCIGVGANAAVATLWLWGWADWEQQCRAAVQRVSAAGRNDNKLEEGRRAHTLEPNTNEKKHLQSTSPLLHDANAQHSYYTSTSSDRQHHSPLPRTAIATMQHNSACNA